MASSPHSGSLESGDANIRKRVCKACDRCRLKKSKCDGANPCSRCKTDNAICVFGERKKSHDKVYPKGYVEMLEQQQTQLVAGLQDMYRRLSTGEQWPGSALTDGPNGHPLTHDILARLDLLQPREDGSHQHEGFEEDCGRLQRRLLDAGAPFIKRRGSISSDSEEHEQQQLSPISNDTSYATTPTSAPPHRPTFTHPFANNSAPMTPPSSSQSPVPFVPQLNTTFKNSCEPQVSNIQPAALHPAGLQDAWVPSTISTNMTFEDNISNMELDSFSPYDFTGVNFESAMATSTPGVMGFGSTGPLLMHEFVNDPNELELNHYLSQPVS
ncbi:MAG: hypothetical protein M1822_004562 [Bathelium mastoideum]|nr:MAG: hypothetical protein M1822_004562 [Bathelium mastoideum]